VAPLAVGGHCGANHVKDGRLISGVCLSQKQVHRASWGRLSGGRDRPGRARPRSDRRILLGLPGAR
jgi:hypothetical protein